MLDNERWWTCFEAAALDPARWITALAELAEATGSHRAQLIGLGGPRAEPFNWITNFCERDRLLFPEADGHSATINFRIAADAISSPEDLVFEHHYDRVRSTLANDSYVAYCEEAQMPLGCQTMVVRDGSELVGLALLRTHADGATDDRVRKMFAQASRAARTAVRLQVALEQQGATLVSGAFETLSIACLLFDRSGRICELSPTAQRLLTVNGPIGLRDNRLVGATPHSAAQIDRALHDLLVAQNKRHVRISLGNASSELEQPCRLDLFRTRSSEWSMGFHPTLIGVIRSDERLIDKLPLLAGAFGLTTAEAAIAGLLVKGVSRQVIAKQRGVTVETLRGQLKALYGKTGCRREAELVALLSNVLT